MLPDTGRGASRFSSDALTAATQPRSTCTIALPAGEDLDAPGTCHAAAIQGLIPFGEKTGQRTVLWGEAEVIDRTRIPPTKKLCADHDGYSLHAGVRISACAGPRRERLARYVARGPISKDRLSMNRQGDVVYRFRHPWCNGKQAVVMDPMTFLSRLAVLIPLPSIGLGGRGHHECRADERLEGWHELVRFGP